MSGEQLTAKDLNKTSITRSSKRVDINNLLAKVREVNNKEKKENLFIEVQKKKYPASIILKPLNSKNIRFT